MEYFVLEVNILNNLKGVFYVFSRFTKLEFISSIIEILIIAYVVYRFLMWIKNTRAYILLRGLVIIGIFIAIAELCHFNVILYILSGLLYPALFALIIVFQDDIRSGLEHLGRQRFFYRFIPNLNKLTNKISKESIQEIVEASFSMSSVKTGALMVIEQNVVLEEYERTGITINGEVTRQLLINIFEKNTPLHDGAVLIVGNIIKSATCYLPLSHNQNISKDLGTRHRAALGISEVSDAITIVVSEETGKVSVCYHGKIKVAHDEKELIKIMFDLVYGKEDTDAKNVTADIIRNWLGK